MCHIMQVVHIWFYFTNLLKLNKMYLLDCTQYSTMSKQKQFLQLCVCLI